MSQVAPCTISVHDTAVTDTINIAIRAVARRFMIAFSPGADTTLREGASPVFVAAIETR
jgi:hypothetical protein